MTKESKTQKRRNLSSMEVTKYKLTHGKKPYRISLEQDHNKIEFLTCGEQEDDIVANSIQKIVNEILENIGDIFIREKLSAHECEMILDALGEKIKRKSQNKR